MAGQTGATDDDFSHRCVFCSAHGKTGKLQE